MIHQAFTLTIRLLQPWQHQMHSFVLKIPLSECMETLQCVSLQNQSPACVYNLMNAICPIGVACIKTMGGPGRRRCV